MRIRVRHATAYRYEQPAEDVIQALRVTPSDHDGQRVRDWRVDVDVDGLLRAQRDAFGNVLHLFFAEQPVTSLTVTVTGEAEVTDVAGVVSGAAEPFSPAVYLRTTPLSAPDATLAAWADRVAAAHARPLDRLHAIMGELNGLMRFDAEATGVETSAAAAFAQRHGVCQDYAHIFIAAARAGGIPARYVSGHLARLEDHEQPAAHAWAEAYVPDLGWVAFDPTNGVSPDQTYLRVAAGLDYLDAAPLRGARRGGGEERLSVTVHARDATPQRQD